jgi:hypothetical protein
MSKRPSRKTQLRTMTLFAICMTSVTALPYCALVFVSTLNHPSHLTEVIIALPLILIGAFIFFLGLGGLGTLTLQLFRGKRTAAGDINDVPENVDETRLIQQLNQCGQRLAQRVEALETILMDRDQTRRTPAPAEREES